MLAVLATVLRSATTDERLTDGLGNEFALQVTTRTKALLLWSYRGRLMYQLCLVIYDKRHRLAILEKASWS
jgi:hypothetical protein